MSGDGVVGKRVAVVKWTDDDATTADIARELANLVYQPVPFRFDQRIPDSVDIVLTYAPYGPWLQVPQQFAGMPAVQRPTVIHCNTENPPDPKIPWIATAALGSFRSWVERLAQSSHAPVRTFGRQLPVLWGRRPMARFRYVGDYYYAYRKGWIDLFVEFSTIYAQYHAAHGLPTTFVPWGTGTGQYADLQLERDIDVLWMGVRRNRRRSDLIETIRSQLSAQGIHMLVVDGVEHPLIFGDTRTQILNRTKIVLNLLTHWYECVLPYRFHMVAGNGCLVISEPELPHSPAILRDIHYVETPPEEIVEAVRHYLAHDQERTQIARNAYDLVTNELTLANTVKAIMAAAEQVHRVRTGRKGNGHGSHHNAR